MAGIRQADLFDPSTGTWVSIAPLITGRYQAGAIGFQGRIWAVGGCDGWNCLTTVEVFDPVTGAWTQGPPLITPRRGAGLQEFRGRLYCVGGDFPKTILELGKKGWLVWEKRCTRLLFGVSSYRPRLSRTGLIEQTRTFGYKDCTESCVGTSDRNCGT